VRSVPRGVVGAAVVAVDVAALRIDTLNGAGAVPVGALADASPPLSLDASIADRYSDRRRCMASNN
jgi:hypothetical protein